MPKIIGLAKEKAGLTGGVMGVMGVGVGMGLEVSL